MLIYFYYYGSQRTAQVIEQTPILFIYCSVALLSYLLSAPVSILFEAPFL